MTLASPPPAATRSSAVALRLTPGQRLVLDAVRRNDAITRAELPAQTALVQQSVSRIVDELSRRGLLAVGERIATGARGKPTVALNLVPGAAYAAGIAVLEESASLAVLDLAGTVLFQATRATGDGPSRDAQLGWLAQTLETCLAEAGVGRDRICGAGLGLSGYFVGLGDRLNAAPQLDDWAFVNVGDLVSEALGLPVWVENDANAAAVGEAMYGVGRWARSFAYLNFTSGFGGGVVIDGRPIRGAHGNAGEFANILGADVDLRPGLKFLIAALREAGVAVDGVPDLVRRFDPTWPGVAGWVERASAVLTRICDAINGVIDPDAIVLGGEIPRGLADLFLSTVQPYAVDRRGAPPPRARLVSSELRGNATAIGAASIPLKETFFV